MSRFPRMFGWQVLAFVLLAIIATVDPQRVPTAIYKLSLITLAEVVG